MDKFPTVFIVEDEPLVRRAVGLMLKTAGHNTKEFESANEFLDHYDPNITGCLISDVQMPGMDGIALLKHLQGRQAPIPIIMLTAYGDIPMAVDAIKTGAVEFLEKPVDADLLREKVADALSADADSRAVRAEIDEVRNLMSTLTPREREVLELLADGKSTRTIATILGTAYNTVRVQRTQIISKMKADSVTDLVKMVHSLDLLSR